MDNISLALIKALCGGGGDPVSGKDGVGIQKIEKTDTQGLIDTYTITLTNGSTATFTVTNGADGVNGVDGANGKNGVDGENGITPTIGENGNWYLGDEDTGKPSRGVQGPTGPTGADGQDGVPGVDGFSPVITEDENNNESTYKLNIENKTGTITTPNLKGADGVIDPDYSLLTNKPRINNVELSGNKTIDELGIQGVSDDTLNTTNKTIVGAINELYAIITSAS